MAFYKDGIISIPNVTGNVVITATAVAQAPHYTNLADPTSEEWLNNSYITSGGAISARTGNFITNPISVSQGDVIRIKGAGEIVNTRAALFSTEGARSGGVFAASSTYDAENDIKTYTITSAYQSDHPFFRITLESQYVPDVNSIIITKNEQIV